MSPALDESRVAAVRRFSRFYTRQIGLLQEGVLQSPFSLTEARVLYELAHRENPTASELATALGLDHGYLSRILRGFETRGLLVKVRSRTDARQMFLSLTVKGRTAFAPLDHRSQKQARAMLARLDPSEQDRVVEAMGTIEQLFGGAAPPERAYVLRPHRPGDMGWVVARHGALYAQDYGWDISFEGTVAEITAQFVKNFNPARERCFIAEMDSEPVGSVFVVRASDDIAKLRLLIVDPSARGRGVGRKLVEECVAFARAAGYRKMTLWTQSILTGARKIYQDCGFTLVASEPHKSWGADLVGETWEKALGLARVAQRHDPPQVG